MAEHGIEVLARISQFLRARDDKRIVRKIDDSFQRRHLLWCYLCSYHVTNEQKFAFAVVHDVVNLLRLKFVLYRYDNGSVSNNGQEGYCPLATISSADGNLVALLHIAVFEQNV